MAIATERVSTRPSDAAATPDLAFRSITWRQVRLVALAGYALTLIVSIALNGIPLDRVGLTLWILVGLSIAVLGKGWSAWLRIMRDWLPFQGVLLAYDYSYGIAGHYGTRGYPHEGDANVLGSPLHVQLPVEFDKALFGGTLPNQWVQEHFASGSTIPWYAAVVTLVYCSHFVVTPLVAVGLWIRARDRFRTWVKLVLVLAVAGMATYFIFPMSPPWLASQQAYIDGPPVERITGQGWSVLGLHVASQVLDDSQNRSNPVAAMPSLHMAYAVLAAVFFMYLTKRRWLRAVLLVYPALMAFSLVYAGEHYVLDELAGAAYALVVIGVWRWWLKRSRARDESLVEPADAVPADAEPAELESELSTGGLTQSEPSRTTST
ncbi:phosphatase PAP2 family protein [Luteipulveratus mongoliensis]|uniref:phosphatase PAP2 family protein n=1 Tax=Luteipulveratus mongoliensis TaxID=571913 RepID=UPI00069856BD|nr:phosphatase PAP2 family protein [Luteipulveratus mongoliensis]